MAQAGYRIKIDKPTDEMVNRDRNVRFASAFISSVIIVTAPILLLGYLGSLMDFKVTGAIIGLIIGGITASIIIPKRMLVINPEWCGYVTQDIFKKGVMVSYGPGVHASHWWEQRNADGNYSLAVQPQTFSPGVTTASGKVIFEGQYEYAIDLSLMDRAIGVSTSIVEKGITAFIDNFLTVRFANKDIENVRGKEALELLGKDLSNELMNDTGTLADIRKEYGYKTVAVIIDKVTLSEDMQKTRDAIDEAGILFKIVAKLHGTTTTVLTKQLKSGAVTSAEYQKMLTRAMAVSDNKTSINVNVIEGLEGSSNPTAHAATLFNALQDGGKRK